MNIEFFQNQFLSGMHQVDSWCLEVLSIPSSMVTAVVVGLIFLYRMVQLWRQPKLEVKRRKWMLSHQRSFLQKALTSNIELLEKLEEARVWRQAEAAIFRMPIKHLASATNVGRGSVESLATHGFSTIGQVDQANLYQVYGLGHVRISSIGRWIDTERERVWRLFYEGREKSEGFEHDPQIDQEFKKAREVVHTRQTELGADVESLIDFDRALEEFQEQTSEVSFGERLQGVAKGVVGTFAHPLSVLGLIALPVVFCVTLFLMPHVLLSWLPHAVEQIAFWAVLSAWVGLHYLLVAYFILADKPLSGLSRLLDPSCFIEQLLQLEALKMAANAGIAPPIVQILPRDDYLACTDGRPSGPSIVYFSTGILRVLQDEQLRAVMGHELGHLRGDHLRFSRTVDWLQKPMRWTTEKLVVIASWLWFLGRYKVFFYRGQSHYSQTYGFKSLIFLPLALPFVLLAAVSLTIEICFTAMKATVGRQQEYEADEAGAELSGDSVYMADALYVVDGGREQLKEQRALLDPTLLLIERETRQVHPVRRWSTRIQMWLAELNSTHPKTSKRIQALHGEGSTPWADMFQGAFRAVGIVGVSFVALYFTFMGVGHVEVYAVEKWDAYQATAESEDQDSGAIESDLETITVQRKCPLRSKPALKSRKLRFLQPGTTCQFVEKKSKAWREVICQEEKGYIHRLCLKKR